MINFEVLNVFGQRCNKMRKAIPSKDHLFEVRQYPLRKYDVPHVFSNTASLKQIEYFVHNTFSASYLRTRHGSGKERLAIFVSALAICPFVVERLFNVLLLPMLFCHKIKMSSQRRHFQLWIF